MKNYAEQRYTQLLEDLELFSDQGTFPYKRLWGKLGAIARAELSLDEFRSSYTFTGIREEAEFFKDHRPRFSAEGIYAIELCGMEMAAANGTQQLQAFCAKERIMIEAYLAEHIFIYRYYKDNRSDMDQTFFSQNSPHPATQIFARIIAYERLLTHMDNETAT